jgi:hypothetical protein
MFKVICTILQNGKYYEIIYNTIHSIVESHCKKTRNKTFIELKEICFIAKVFFMVVGRGNMYSYLPKNLEYK